MERANIFGVKICQTYIGNRICPKLSILLGYADLEEKSSRCIFKNSKAWVNRPHPQ